MKDWNLLVSSCSWTPARAEREILTRLRALGDETPAVEPTGVRGMFGVRTHLEPRQVIRDLRVTCERSPQAFRHTFRWIPVDACTALDLEAMKQAKVLHVELFDDRVALAVLCPTDVFSVVRTLKGPQPGDRGADDLAAERQRSDAAGRSVSTPERG